MLYTRRRFSAMLLGLGLSPVLPGVARAEDAQKKPVSYSSTVVRTFTRNGRPYARGALTATTQKQGADTEIYGVILSCYLWPEPAKYRGDKLIARKRVTYKADGRDNSLHEVPVDIRRIRFEVPRSNPPSAPVRLMHRLYVDKGEQIDAARYARSLRTDNYKSLNAHFRFLDKDGKDSFRSFVGDPLPFRVVIEPFVMRITTADTGVATLPGQRIYVYSNERRVKPGNTPEWFSHDLDQSLEKLGYVGLKSGLQDVERIEFAIPRSEGENTVFATLDPAAIRAVNDAAPELFKEAHQNLRASRGKPNYDAGCLLSTAACTIVGLPDEAWELRALRRFRDEYLALSPHAAAVQQYYRLSTRLLATPFARAAVGQRAFASLYRSMILPCALLALLRLHRPCLALYRRQVHRLIRRARRFGQEEAAAVGQIGADVSFGAEVRGDL